MDEKYDRIEFILSHLREPEKLLDEKFIEWLLIKENKELFEEVILNREAFLREEYGRQIVVSEEWKKFRQKVQEKNMTSQRSRTIRQHRVGRRAWLSVVACTGVLLSVAGGLMLKQHFTKQKTIQVAKEVHKGKQGAILTTASGQVYDLTQTEIHLETPQGTQIVNDTSNLLAYQTNSPAGSQYQQVRDSQIILPSYHTIQIPAGTDYGVTLTDGTRIWLNCESKLRFPEQFEEGKPREVFLEGEGFFQVVHAEGWPFIVNTKGMKVQVTGTCFNVKSYPTEDIVHTTLVEGSVWAYTDKSKVLLKPSEQFRLDRITGETSVQKVDTDLYTGWVKGMFVFRNQRLEDVMNEVARWYGMTIFYTNPEAKEIKISANLDKYEEIDNLLEIINESGKVLAVRKANTITVQTR